MQKDDPSMKVLVTYERIWNVHFQTWAYDKINGQAHGNINCTTIEEAIDCAESFLRESPKATIQIAYYDKEVERIES